MGYRVYINTKRIIEYKGGYFNNCSQDLADFLYDLKNEIDETDYPFHIDDENGILLEDWEIEKEWLEVAIEYLKKNKKPDNEAFNGYTYKDIIDNFQYWLDESDKKENFSDPSFVYLTWF